MFTRFLWTLTLLMPPDYLSDQTCSLFFEYHLDILPWCYLDHTNCHTLQKHSDRVRQRLIMVEIQ